MTAVLMAIGTIALARQQMLSDQQLLRYSRQIFLPQIDVAGQQKISAAAALLVGCGGLGSPVALYLAAAGIGKLVLCDFDRVDESNLQRQIGHGQGDLGRPKVDSLADSVLAINPELEVVKISKELTDSELVTWAQQVDVVLDCTDNFLTRLAVNKACVEVQAPLVSGAAIGFDGQLAVFDRRQSHSPCYRCLFDVDDNDSRSCSENGVLSPLVGIVGSLQAQEALRLLANFGQSQLGLLRTYDGLSGDWQRFKVGRDPDCPVCGDGSDQSA